MFARRKTKNSLGNKCVNCTKDYSKVKTFDELIEQKHGKTLSE
jgi:hypothetical protein